MKKTFFLMFALAGVAFLSGCQNAVTDKAPAAPTGQAVEQNASNPAADGKASEQKTDAPAKIANPASENCVAKGGRLEMRDNKKGQYGVCIFEDNRQCEEWALSRGQCPAGGVKVTGYQSEAEAYCAITGGEVQGLGTATPMCKRVDGTLCAAQANFDGECPDPNDPNPSAGNVEAK